MNKDRIIEIANENNGYLYKDIIKEYNIDTIYITRLVRENKLTKISRGVYITSIGHNDYLYIMHLKYSKIIYGGHTALFLNGLLKKNREIKDYEVLVPYGTKIQKKDSLSVRYVKNDAYNLGGELIATPFNNKVRCYNKERCICDLFIKPDNYTIETKAYALSVYKKKYYNEEKLYEYASKLGVLKHIKREFEN